MRPQPHIETQNLLRESVEALLNHKGWTSTTTLNDEFTVRDAVCGAISNAPAKTDRVGLLESLREDYLFIADILRREIDYRRGYSHAQTIKPPETVIIKNILHSPEEVAKEFGLTRNDIKNKRWRDTNNFPYRQFKEGGKVAYHRTDIENWMKNRKAG